MIILAIDPGLSFGGCILEDGDNPFVFGGDILTWSPGPALKELIANVDVVFVERVDWSRSPLGWSAAVSAGVIIGVLQLMQFKLNGDLHFVAPSEWQKRVLPRGVRTRAELKKASMETAQALFPNAAILDDNQSDAVCLAYYGSSS